MKQNRIVAILAGLAVLAFAGAYLASPVFAIRALQAAAREGDRDTLDALVDFPQVREGFKSQLNAAIARRMREDPEMASNPFAALGAALAPTLVNGLVDAYVTPDAIAQMVQTGDRPDEPAAEPTPPQAQPQAKPAEDKPKVSYGYNGGLDRFDTKVEGDSGALTFQMRRTGVFAWRLTRIELPLDDS